MMLIRMLIVGLVFSGLTTPCRAQQTLDEILRDLNAQLQLLLQRILELEALSAADLLASSTTTPTTETSTTASTTTPTTASTTTPITPTTASTTTSTTPTTASTTTPTTTSTTTPTTTTPTTTTPTTTTPTTSTITCACPAGGVEWCGSATGSCYVMPATTATFDAARAACKQLSPCADLVTVDEPGENDFILTFVIRNPQMNAIKISSSGVWLGAKKSGTNWQWQNTSQIFLREDPKNDFYTGLDPADGDCLVMWKGFAYKWGDFSCSSQQAYICEVSTKALSLTTTPQSCSTCPFGFTSWSQSPTGSCYLASSQAKTWDEAVAACKILSPCARLATLEEAGESAFLKTSVFNTVATSGFWLNAKKSGTAWEWQETGQKFIEEDPDADYYPFDPVRVGDCLTTWRAFSHQWGDYPCTSKLGYVCEVQTKEAITTTAAAGICSCPSTFTTRSGSASGSCYFATPTRRTWSDAEAACKILSPCATLAAIDEAGEHDWLAGHFASLGHIPSAGQGGVWVGGKVLGNNNYQWTPTGGGFTRTDPNVKIRVTEPNGDGECFIMWRTFGYEMGDFPCASRQGYVCEIKTK